MLLELYAKIVNWIKEQEGQDLVEYALIAGLIALVCFLAIQLAGNQVSIIWNSIQNALVQAAS